MSHAEMTDHGSEPWIPEDRFGVRLAAVRATRKWNVDQAAKACGVPSSSWRNWEHGTRCLTLPRIVERVARTTGCDPVWLMMGGPLAHPSTDLDPEREVHLKLVAEPAETTGVVAHRRLGESPRLSRVVRRAHDSWRGGEVGDRSMREAL